VHLTIAGYIAVQSDRNEFLKRENVRLDIGNRGDQKAEERDCSAPCAQAAFIGGCKRTVRQAVYMLQELVQAGTDGVYLKAIKQTA